MFYMAFLASFLFPLVSTASSTSCLWLDTSANNATVPATGYAPCAYAGAKTCCANGDVCLSNGYCTGSFGLYRGACTDWTAGVCPDTCADLSFVSQGVTYYLANLYRCNGEGQGEMWWCGDQSADTTAQPCQTDVGTMFSMTSIGTLVTPVAFVAATTVTSFRTGTITGSSIDSTAAISRTSTSSSAFAAGAATSTAALTTSDNPSTGNSSTLGIGLGVGLGLPLIAAIVALTYVIARRKANTSAAWGRLEKQGFSNQQPQAWSSSETKREELYGRQIYEVAAIHQRAELGGTPR
jgi:hypothetical protein